MNIGRNVKRRRTALGWNRHQLAMKARMSWGALDALEAGGTNPSVRILGRLAKALGCTVAELCG